MKKINGYTDLFALFGYPAKHSLSPFIQNHFFDKYGLNSVYLSFEINPSDFKDTFLGAKKMGFSGINLTMPFKEDCIEYLDELDEDAKFVKSVNTVKFDKKENKAKGFNTDIKGFVKSLNDADFKAANSSCLIIGAGGVAKSSVYALLKMNAGKIFLYDINIKKAQEIKSIYNKTINNKIFVLNNLNSISLKELDFIANCTPAGMKLKNIDNNVNVLPLPEKWNLERKFIFEMVYNPVFTPLVKKSLDDGAKVIFGLDMLLNQAAFAFEIWKDFSPDLKYLKRHFKNSIK